MIEEKYKFPTCDRNVFKKFTLGPIIFRTKNITLLQRILENNFQWNFPKQLSPQNLKIKPFTEDV